MTYFHNQEKLVMILFKETGDQYESRS